ncbi:MAG TPA: hypothetical protein VFH61_06540 [Thermoleophilia bacterium]|nr:hypothetical protein [Thermoleophilia bacterium]
MDLNIVIPAAIAAFATVVVAMISRSSKGSIIKTEAQHDFDDRDQLIKSLSAALLHCLQEHGGRA